MLTSLQLVSSASLLNNDKNLNCSFLFSQKQPFKTVSSKSYKTGAIEEKTEASYSSSSSSSADEITKKYGLEVGLWKVGISANGAGEKVGTFALAYAAHKAASPIPQPLLSLP